MATKAWKNWGAEEITSAKLNLMQPVYDTFANIPATPTVGMVFIATDTLELYVCFVAGSWTDVAGVEAAARASADSGKVNNTGDESIAGIKTFGSIPLLPASDPTTDNQAVRKLYAEKMGGCYVAGDTLLISSDTERQTNSGSYVKLKEIHIPKGGTLRIKFSVAGTISGQGTAYAQIYRNGVAVGTERSAPLGGGYEEFSEDISGWEPDDFVQIYAKMSGAVVSKVKNFRIYGTLFYAPEVTMD